MAVRSAAEPPRQPDAKGEAASDVEPFDVVEKWQGTTNHEMMPPTQPMSTVSNVPSLDRVTTLELWSRHQNIIHQTRPDHVDFDDIEPKGPRQII